MHFKDALKREGVNIIAEFKRASPSLGDIDVAADPVAKAKIYEQGGAAAMSVLCDAARFKGSVEDLRRVAASGEKIPLLAKDFISEKERLREVKDAGASAALLIVRYLDDEKLSELLVEARSLGLDALVETHSEEEIKRAVAVGADIIGVNCRDLSNFTVDVSISERLLKAIPDGIVKVAESGIKTPADIARLRAAGANAFLIGTALMKSQDPEGALRSLLESATL
jgi:indole-3-glycerol phosphate synthase